MKIRIAVLPAAILMSMSAAAIADSDQARGRETRAWLAKQKSSAAQAPDPRGLPGEAADRVYQRYLQSFAKPIPERFERDRASSDTQR